MSRMHVWLLSIVAGVLLFVANVSWWTWGNVLDSDAFVSTTSASLQREDVRAAIAGASVEAALGADNRERTAGALLIDALTGILGNDQFAVVYDRLAALLYNILKAGRIETISVDIRVLHPAMRAYAVLSSDQSIVRALRADLPNEVVIFEGRDVPWLEQITVLTPWIATATLVLGIALLVLAVRRARDRRHALRMAGGTLVVVSVLLLVLLFPLRDMVAAAFPSRDAETIALAMLEGFASRLVWQTLVVVAAGAGLLALASVRASAQSASTGAIPEQERA